MLRVVRCSLVGGFAAAVVAAGVTTVAPEAVAGVPRSASASVALASSGESLQPVGCSPETCWSGPDVVTSTNMVVYAPADAWAVESVSHPLGLVPQLVAGLIKPPIYSAIAGQQMATVAAAVPQVITDLAAFGGYANAAVDVVGLHLTTAVMDTVKPAQWGGGKVLQDWGNVGIALQAVTIGIGATVDGAWVPSLRVAAVSIRNQIANDIAGLSPTSIGALPNYAAHYTPVGCSGNKNGGCAVLPVTTSVGCAGNPNVWCGVMETGIVENPAAARPAAARTARSASRVTPKSSAAAAPRAAAARTRSAQ